MSLLESLLNKFQSQDNKPVVPTPAFDIVEVSADTVEIKFGFSSLGRVTYDPNQTYADFVKQQAAITGTTLQSNYTAQYIVDGRTFVVDPTLTFAQLNEKYQVENNAPIVVSVPDPEKPAGELG